MHHSLDVLADYNPKSETFTMHSLTGKFLDLESIASMRPVVFDDQSQGAGIGQAFGGHAYYDRIGTGSF
jgi:hypothetical protein